MEHQALLWVLFLAGQVLHILKRAEFAVRSVANPTKSRLDFLRRNWMAVAVRVALGAAVFAFLATDKVPLGQLLTLVGITVSAPIPLGYGASFVYGYCADSVLDWLCEKVPRLGKEIPPFNGNST